MEFPSHPLPNRAREMWYVSVRTLKFYVGKSLGDYAMGIAGFIRKILKVPE
jgi:hypothetical protein